LRLVAYPPFAVMDGVRWAQAAANEGSGAAAHLLALLAAEGLGVTQDWNMALAWLQRACELDYAPAHAQLAALAGEWEMAAAIRDGSPGGEDVARLRQAIDLQAWLTVPPARSISDAPRLAVVENFLSPEACDWLIAAGRPHLDRAKVYDIDTGLLTDQGERTNSAAGFDFSRADLVLAFTRARMATIAGLSQAGFEDTSLLHYNAGEEFSPHYDFFDPRVPGHVPELQAGQRVATFLTYLNEDFEGGETAFPEIDRQNRGKKGDALLFWNAALDGTPDALTLHAGRPVGAGEKWLLSQWIRHRPG
jgi:prolyl 4-hydroxylase